MLHCRPGCLSDRVASLLEEAAEHIIYPVELLPISGRVSSSQSDLIIFELPDQVIFAAHTKRHLAVRAFFILPIFPPYSTHTFHPRDDWITAWSRFLNRITLNMRSIHS